ncbi:MAG: hypothetical protein PHY47_16070 [Lachnospiraceae bacterium]|nr:hypothetical protein [Lachnospiraceae bacterium]
MEKRQKAEMLSVLLIAVEIGKELIKYSYGGYSMDGLTVAEVLKNIVDIGITPVLLVIFIVFFIRRANDDDARVKKAYSDAQKKIEDCNKEVKDRENTLMSENAKREEILRQESEKRENLIRREAEKREGILMANQDRMLNSMDQITSSLSKIEISLNKMESRHESDITQIKDQMHNLEHKIDHMGGS